jgi:hypothetical protein
VNPHNLKVGDLVRFKEEHPHKKMGIVVSIRASSRRPVLAKVVWGNDYGTFWGKTTQLEVLNGNR